MYVKFLSEINLHFVGDDPSLIVWNEQTHEFEYVIALADEVVLLRDFPEVDVRLVILTVFEYVWQVSPRHVDSVVDVEVVVVQQIACAEVEGVVGLRVIQEHCTQRLLFEVAFERGNVVCEQPLCVRVFSHTLIQYWLQIVYHQQNI